ncbi:hypothetical protein [Staphylococcus caledonicus]|uniref:hypothetical protein n=1 Tax=Staphylococcus caledonicus TaxID=2741333 RepID=UPI0018E4658C|nr:hypothetical protein [Staphylococcus caledonicus]MBI5973910.1 hypothetical protein [Staphylococcus caledonicus]
MKDKQKPHSQNKKESLLNKIKYFKISMLLTLLLLVLVLVFICLLIMQKQVNYFAALLSSNTALLAIFVKIEWDEYKEKLKNRNNNRRLILAYYNELKNMQLVFGRYRYKYRKTGADINIIDEKMKEAEWNEMPIDVYYNKAIKSEIERGLHNLEVRISNHENLEKSIKNMLLESNMPISGKLFDEFWNVQKEYHKIYTRPLKYDEWKEKLSEPMKNYNPQIYHLSYDYWEEIYKALAAIDMNVKLDTHMEEIINNMIKTLNENK